MILLLIPIVLGMLWMVASFYIAKFAAGKFYKISGNKRKKELIYYSVLVVMLLFPFHREIYLTLIFDNYLCKKYAGMIINRKENIRDIYVETYSPSIFLNNLLTGEINYIEFSPTPRISNVLPGKFYRASITRDHALCDTLGIINLLLSEEGVEKFYLPVEKKGECLSITKIDEPRSNYIYGESIIKFDSKGNLIKNLDFIGWFDRKLLNSLHANYFFVKSKKTDQYVKIYQWLRAKAGFWHNLFALSGTPASITCRGDGQEDLSYFYEQILK